MCYNLLEEREIPPEHVVVYREFTHVFTVCLRSTESSLFTTKSSLDSTENIFPFCEDCRPGVIKLHKNYFQLQSRRRRIKQATATTRRQRILYETTEKGGLVSDSEISMDAKTGKQLEKQPVSIIGVRCETDDEAESVLESARNNVTCQDAGIEVDSSNATS